MIRNFIKSIGSAAKGSNPKGSELVGKNETFRHTPGKLTAELLLTPSREDEFISRRKVIDAARTDAASIATGIYAKAVTDARITRDYALEAAESDWRREMRALYCEFNQVSSEPLSVSKAAPTPGTDTAAAPSIQRRRMQPPLVTSNPDGGLLGGIPDRTAEVVAERQA